MRRHYSAGEQPSHSNGMSAMRPKSATLPAGWSIEVDNTGRTFYFNTETRVSSWRPPSTSSQSENDDVCLVYNYYTIVHNSVQSPFEAPRLTEI